MKICHTRTESHRETMKQRSTGYGTCNSLDTFFDDADKEVAEILLELPKLRLASESLHRSSFTWGGKRKRSAIVSSPLLHSTPSQPSILRTCVGEDEKPISKTEKATSPVTPLSFSPSESDGKSKRKNSKKMKKEEWLKIITDLTQQREMLQGEIMTVSRYCEELKTFNMELKARKQELSLCRNEEKPNLETGKIMSLAMESTQSDRVKSPTPQQIPTKAHQPPLINDQTAYKWCGERTRFSSGLVGSVGVPDLNISIEENLGMDCFDFQVLDMNHALNRAMAAEARRKRMKIYKEKNSIAVKPCNGRR